MEREEYFMKSKRIIAVFLMALMIITTGLSEVKNMNIKAADTENIAYKKNHYSIICRIRRIFGV